MNASPAPDSRRRALALIITGAAVFMVTLDNLVVTNALPSIRADLGASISQLGWFVNAYTLTFAALLLTGASLGDRFGRRRVFVLGLAIFTAGSLGAALATSSGLLIAARSVQGLGAALVMPLSLTLLAAVFPPDRRGLAIGIWSGLSGLAVALGPVVGGAVVDGLSWQWIFFLNVPIGIVLAPFAYRVLDESHGPDAALDVRGLVLASTGLFALVWGIVRGNDQGWLSGEIVGALRTRHRAARGVRRLGAPHPRADAAAATVPEPRLQRNQRRLADHELRDLRIDLPAGAVPADRAGVFGLRRGRAHAPLDADADVRRAARGPVLRPHRQPAADVHRARAAGDGARLARQRGLADGRLQQSGRPASSSPASAWHSSSRRSRT